MPTPLKILMLHGFGQTPSMFHTQTHALETALTKAVLQHSLHLHYHTAPNRPAPRRYKPAATDSPVEEAPETYAWWQPKRDDAPIESVYEGLEKTLENIADCIRAEGPFDGVMGFSQGAAAAVIVAALLEGNERKKGFEQAEGKGGMPFPSSFLMRNGDKAGVGGFVQGPLKFAVSYGGLGVTGTRYQGFFDPKIRTPTLHVVGQTDEVVKDWELRRLVEACEGGANRMLVHPGGHYVPSQKPWFDAVVGFVKDHVEGNG